MVLAIVDRHLNIHNGEPVNAALQHRLNDPFLDRGNEPPRDRTSLDLIHKFKAFSPWLRAEDEVADAELAMTSRLFLVFALGISRSRDRLAVGDPHLLLVNFNTELAAELLDRDVHMAVAESVEECLVGLAVALKPQGRILLEDPIQG